MNRNNWKIPVTIATSLLTIAGGLAIAPQVKAQDANINITKSGGYQAIFPSTDPKGTERTYVIEDWYVNKTAPTTNACGYKGFSQPATGSIYSIKYNDSMAVASTLEVFDGSCKAGTAGSTLVPKVEGSAIPTGNYKDATGKIWIKDSTASFVQIKYNNFEKKLKAGNCGEYKLSTPTPKPGQPAIPFPFVLSFNGTTIDIEDELQVPQGAFCKKIYYLTPAGLVDSVYKMFFE